MDGKEGNDWRPFSLKNSGFWLISRVGKGKRFLRFPYICAHENSPKMAGMGIGFESKVNHSKPLGKPINRVFQQIITLKR